MNHLIYRVSGVLLLSSGMLLVGCAPVRETGIEHLNAQAVRNLFVGKTVESVNLKSKATSFTYYGSDGRVMQQRYWSKRSGHWSINDKGEMCLTFSKTQCRSLVQTAGRYYKVKEDSTPVVRYRGFAVGNLLLAGGEDWPKSKVFKP